MFKVFEEKTKQNSRPKFFGILRSVAEGKQTYFVFGLMYCFVDALRDLDVRRLQAQFLLLFIIIKIVVD